MQASFWLRSAQRLCKCKYSRQGVAGSFPCGGAARQQPVVHAPQPICPSALLILLAAGDEVIACVACQPCGIKSPACPSICGYMLLQSSQVIQLPHAAPLCNEGPFQDPSPCMPDIPTFSHAVKDAGVLLALLLLKADSLAARGISCCLGCIRSVILVIHEGMLALRW